jgi:hypothetical protein
MKNPFKRISDLEKRVHEIEKKNSDTWIRDVKKSWEQHKAKWQSENPPKFKYGDEVEVSEWNNISPLGKRISLKYTGIVMAYLKTDERFVILNNNPNCPPKINIDITREYSNVYCIGVKDFKYHEANESDMSLINPETKS